MLTSVELSNLEKSAVDLIKSALRENNLPDDPLYFRRAEKYLTVGGNDHIPFVRLKLDKNLWYISIRCGDPETKKSYLRFDISDVSEIQKYSNEIARAFRFSDPNYTERHFASLDGVSLSPEMQEFFSRMEVPTDAAQKCKLNSSEIAFFTAYVERLKAAGLNWKIAKPTRGSDGVIGVRGGAIRLRSKNIQFKYWPKADSIAVWKKGLTLEECISNLKYWINDCIRNKDIYEI